MSNKEKYWDHNPINFKNEGLWHKKKILACLFDYCYVLHLPIYHFYREFYVFIFYAVVYSLLMQPEGVLLFSISGKASLVMNSFLWFGYEVYLKMDQVLKA
jgi:hypothetical protein